MIEDVVVYLVRDGKPISWGRDTLLVAQRFCNLPLWPAHSDDQFIAVDDWGHGNIVAATSSFKSWIGRPFVMFNRADLA